MSIATFGSGLVGSFFSLALLAKFNRQRIFFLSQVVSAVNLVLVGVLQVVPSYWERTDLVWGQE